MIVSINYANEKYKKHQSINTKTARLLGKVDKAYSFVQEDIDKDFFEKNRNILSQERGNGLWLWKPYFIDKIMNELNDGDVICYADSGIAYLRNVQELITKLRESRQDIMLFEIPLIECQWTKKEVFDVLEAYTETVRFSNQIMATVIVVIINDRSRDFIKKWLKLCQKKILIFPKEEDENEWYIAHREDQSILSVLAKKEGINSFSDPTDYGKFPILIQYLTHKRMFRINKKETPYQLDKTYFLLTRDENFYKYLLKYWIRCFLSKIRLTILRKKQSFYK
ncbi:hypothetical protein FACS189451_02950 [Bacteroidia bacterium]|nr:hypothetical protein FACS189451_02950 [Bacteroidia bacterium]